MAQLIYGRKKQIRFLNDNEFYESLGFLSKNNDTTSLHWEHNEDQGAWGSEGRIHCYKDIIRFPLYFSRAFTAGRGRVIHRINCNEYLKYIVTNNNFVYGNIQNIPNIISTIPAINIVDFNRGLVI
jgi:hypothetical protein